MGVCENCLHWDSNPPDNVYIRYSLRRLGVCRAVGQDERTAFFIMAPVGKVHLVTKPDFGCRAFVDACDYHDNGG